MDREYLQRQLNQMQDLIERLRNRELSISAFVTDQWTLIELIKDFRIQWVDGYLYLLNEIEDINSVALDLEKKVLDVTDLKIVESNLRKMSELIQTQNLIEMILDDLADDYSGLYFILALSSDCFPNGSDEYLKERCLSAISTLLEEGMARAGFPNKEGGFDAWMGSSEDIVQKIKDDWDELSRDPQVDEVVWLSLPKWVEREIRI